MSNSENRAEERPEIPEKLVPRQESEDPILEATEDESADSSTQSERGD